MSFVDHLEALRWHIVRSLIGWIIVATALFIWRDWLFDHVILAPSRSGFVSYGLLCRMGHSLGLGSSLCMPPVNVPLQGNTVSGPFVTALNISMMGGFILAFPYIFYEFWKFIRPALTDKEQRTWRGSIWWVSFCFLLGAAFGYYILAPFTFNFLANFSIGTTKAYTYLPTLDDYISTLTNLLLGCGVAFELPILAVVLAKVGLVSTRFLKAYRRHAYVVIIIIAAVLTPSPDWISQAIVAAPLLLLYEVSIILVKRIDRSKAPATWE